MNEKSTSTNPLTKRNFTATLRRQSGSKSTGNSKSGILSVSRGKQFVREGWSHCHLLLSSYSMLIPHSVDARLGPVV